MDNTPADHERREVGRLGVRAPWDEVGGGNIAADLVLTEGSLRLVPTPESERMILDQAREQAEQEAAQTSWMFRGIKRRAIVKMGYYMVHPEEVEQERFYWRWPLRKMLEEMRHRSSLTRAEVWLDETGLHVNGANVDDVIEPGEFDEAQARVFVDRFEKAKRAVLQRG